MVIDWISCNSSGGYAIDLFRFNTVSCMIKKIFLILFIFNSAHSIEFTGKFEQGSFILGKTEPGSEIKIDKKIRVTKDGFFAFGIGRDRKNNILIELKRDKEKITYEKKILKRKYKVQRIDGLPSKQVTPPPEVYERIKEDNKKIVRAREKNSDLDYFKNKFINPLEKYIVTGVYGSQRILNGKPRSPHYGIDFHAPEGTPIKAMLDGEVSLIEEDMYYTGGTIIFDHGHGISTLYMHKKEIYVKENETIKQGQIIGTLGKSGRATGPHLDVRLNWFGVKLDPSSVLSLK